MFLNLCRGFVIDHDALRAHLLSGHLAGAAVDVFLDEPRSAGEEFTSVLRGLPNVILTPHIGGSTEEAQADIGSFVGAKLADFIAEGTTSVSVNLPQVTLPPAAGTHRLAHLHRNVRSGPGTSSSTRTCAPRTRPTGLAASAARPERSCGPLMLPRSRRYSPPAARRACRSSSRAATPAWSAAPSRRPSRQAASR
jgi:hypothetical protein